ncbi:LIC12162 family protein [Amylibacter sp.]|nr:LIC12162 family protein [Amylibacter sp.]
MDSKILITTALESTWAEGSQPVVFLGQWCLRHNRKKVWEDLNYDVAKYHWDDRQKLYTDYQYLNKLHELLLFEMQKYLNKLHGTSHSIRYWRIQLGPWMGYFIPILFDRWSMLRNIKKDYDISEVYSITTKLEDFIAQDTSDFNKLSMSDNWNERIFSELALILGFNLKKKHCEFAESSRDEIAQVQAIGSSIKSCLRAFWQFMGYYLTSDNSVFVISPYLRLKKFLKFQLKLGQFPVQWLRPNIRVDEKPDYFLRNEISEWPEGFEDIALIMMKRHIPIVYCEGYKSTLASVKELSWPSSPKSIVTAISWSEDDIFKLWAGSNVEKGTRLITIQHGGNYGVSKWNFLEEHQIKISDKFLSWGWQDNTNNKIVPFCNVKTIDNKPIHSPKGGVLLIGLALPVFSYHMYSSLVTLGQWNQHFCDQVTFLEGLPKEIINQTTLRLGSPDYGCCQREKWHELLDNFPIILEEESDCSIYKSYGKSRLCISTYNATVFLETMSYGIPTLIFWNPDHWELRDTAVDYFDLLQDVGIFHKTPESASNHLAEIWDDIDGWWNSDEVVFVREVFCNKYSRSINSPLDMLKAICVDNEAPL